METMATTSPNTSQLLRSTRFWVYTMFFLTGLLHYAIRYALNMSIVCMVVPQQFRNNTEDMEELLGNETMDSANETTMVSGCAQSISSAKDFGYEGEFYWSRSQVGYIIGSFFYAYIPMQLLAGSLAKKFGIRNVLGIGMLIGGVLSLLTPLAARLHYGVLIALRVIMGFSMGVSFPCMHSCIMQWVPQQERGTYFGYTYSGSSVGVILSFLLSGYLCRYSWTYVFYIFGAVTIIWFAVFMYNVSNDPDDHPRISEQEKTFIKESNKAMSSEASSQKIPIPWLRMLTSPAVIALCVTHFAVVWVFYTVNAGIPLYMQDVLYFNIKSNGVLSSLPSLLQIVYGTSIGVTSDLVHRKLIKSRLAMRRITMTITAVGGAVVLVAMGFMTCHQRAAAVVLFCLIFFFLSFPRAGHSCTPSDIAPLMSGTVYGVSNCVGNFPGFLAPIAIGNLTPTGTQAEWQKIFFLSAGLLMAGWLAFMLFVPIDEQAWAKGKPAIIVTNIPEKEVLDEENQTTPLKKADEDNGTHIDNIEL